MSAPELPTEDTHLTLVILGTMIACVLAVIRWLAKKAHVVIFVSGTTVLLVVLAVLVMAYLVAQNGLR